jgi:Family of unknown function (DUF5343)
MAEIIYTIVPGKLKELLQKIRTMGVPPKASVEWLKSIGFKSSNDPSMLRVLKGIGLAADDGTPAQPWRDYRGADHKAVLARCIRSGYADLFQTYPDAQTRGNDALEHFFAAKSDAGGGAITMAVSTFKALCQLSEFGSGPGEEFGSQAHEEIELQPPVIARSQVKAAGGQRTVGSTININIQLTLPETTDESVYEKFFAAMNKHLLAGD